MNLFYVAMILAYHYVSLNFYILGIVVDTVLLLVGLMPARSSEVRAQAQCTTQTDASMMEPLGKFGKHV